MKEFIWLLFVWFRDHILKYMGDEEYLKLVYWIMNRERLNLKKPRTFNEKLNWIKIHDRNPIYTLMADKYEAKGFVEKRLGTNENIVPCFGVYNSFDDINVYDLPDRFVLKTTFDSSGVIVVRDKMKFDFNTVERKINKCMKRDYFFASREWPYKNIPHRLIIDQYLDNHADRELADYKFWCFNGEPKVVYVTNKGTHVCENFYDMNWRELNIDHGFPRKKPEFSKPEALEEMRRMAKLISKDIPFVRVDFFYVDQHVWFGECTFFDWGGMRAFKSKEWDRLLGEWIILPEPKITEHED